MKKSRKFVNAIAAVFVLASVFSLNGCGTAENTDLQTDADTVQAQENLQEQGEGAGEQRAYSDKEQERMRELQKSYQEEIVKPEKMILEVGSAEDVTEGTLCYIISTGQFYLPDRELTDEELLEIIDCNFRIALNTNKKTAAEYEAEDYAKRAMLEEQVKTADGISEEDAIEIARKALEADLGEKGKKMKLRLWNDHYGWKTDLCVADWSEIKEEDRGAVAYSMQFDLGDDVDDWISYICTVNAVDGSILEAYKMELTLEDGYVCNTTYYEH